MYNLPSKPGCILHLCIFCPASQDAFHIHVYILPNKPGCTLYIFIPPSNSGSFLHLPNKPGCILDTFIYCSTSQGAFCLNVYSTQQLRGHFVYMSILPNKPGCILQTFIPCPASKGAFHIHVSPAHSCPPIFFPLNMSLP